MAKQFNGSCEHHLDPKGRVTIPAQFREGLGEEFTLGLNGDFSAIALYPKGEWEKISRKLDRIPMSDARGMAYVRMINGFSYPEQQLDGQGRILIPATLRAKAKLTKEITFVGMGRYLEVWDVQEFVNFTSVTEEKFSDIESHVYQNYFMDTDE